MTETMLIKQLNRLLEMKKGDIAHYEECLGRHDEGRKVYAEKIADLELVKELIENQIKQLELESESQE
jgi:hypothetical protein